MVEQAPSPSVGGVVNGGAKKNLKVQTALRPSNICVGALTAWFLFQTWAVLSGRASAGPYCWRDSERIAKGW